MSFSRIFVLKKTINPRIQDSLSGLYFILFYPFPLSMFVYLHYLVAVYTLQLMFFLSSVFDLFVFKEIFV